MELVLAKELLARHPEWKDKPVNNVIDSWDEMIAEDEDADYRFVDLDEFNSVKDLEEQARLENDGWRDTFYIKVKIPPSPTDAFAAGMDFYESYAPDEAQPLYYNGELYIRIWYD